MKNNGIKVAKYYREYRISNVLAMLRNNNKAPLVCAQDFKGKLVVITGATSGIGLATARKFASQGADLVCINRSRERSDRLKQELEEAYRVRCEIILADLSDPEQTRQATHQLVQLDRPIDVLIHNAGIYLTTRQTTAQGIEKVFMVNHLSSFMINYLLKEKLQSQGKARILLVNSEGHRFAAWGLRFDDLDWTQRRYSGLKSYGSAKLAQLLTMLEFDAYFEGSGVTINAMHPGAVKTATGQDNGRLYKWFKKTLLDKALDSVAIAAEALYYLGVSDDLEGVSGQFFNLTTMEEPAPPALDRSSAAVIWQKSLEMGDLDG